MPSRSTRAAGLFAVLTLLLAACAGPSRSTGDYENKVAQTAQMMISVLETARLGAEEAAGGDTFAPFTSVLMREMEEDASSVRSSLSTRQPPGPEADRLRAGIDPLLGDATSLLAEMRIAAFRGDATALGRHARDIQGLVEQLREYEELTAT